MYNAHTKAAQCTDNGGHCMSEALSCRSEHIAKEANVSAVDRSPMLSFGDLKRFGTSSDPLTFSEELLSWRPSATGTPERGFRVRPSAHNMRTAKRSEDLRIKRTKYVHYTHIIHTKYTQEANLKGLGSLYILYLNFIKPAGTSKRSRS